MTRRSQPSQFLHEQNHQGGFANAGLVDEYLCYWLQIDLNLHLSTSQYILNRFCNAQMSEHVGTP